MMRKLTKPFGFLLGTAFLILLLICCKKTEHSIRNEPLTMIELKKTVIDFQQQTSSNRWSSSERNKLENLISHLDYNSSAQISNPDGSTLFLIKIAASSNIVNKFLGIRKKESAYGFEGLFLSDDLATIQTFYRTQELAPAKYIMIKSLNGLTIDGWRTENNGKTSRAKGEFRSAFVKLSKIRENWSLRSASASTNYVADPNNPCRYLYTIWYVEETGEILAIIYDGTTGNCGGDDDGGGGDGPQPPTQCGLDEEETNALMNQVDIGYNNEEQELSGTSEGNDGVDEMGNTVENWVARAYIRKWSLLYQVDFVRKYWAKYRGKRVHYSYDPDWRWYSTPDYTGEIVQTGLILPCQEVTLDYTPLSVSVSPDRREASVYFQVSFDVKFIHKLSFSFYNKTEYGSTTITPDK